MSYLRVVDRFFPREIIVPVLVVFSLENLISAAFGALVEPESSAVAWTVIFVVSFVAGAVWGELDDEENFE